MPVCCFCRKFRDYPEQCQDEKWLGTFWVGDVEYEGPVCPECCARKLDEDFPSGVVSLKDDVLLPELAIESRAHPNMAPYQRDES